ncbi:unnamed protein product, partial [Prorocentrum cordatum]
GVYEAKKLDRVNKMFKDGAMPRWQFINVFEKCASFFKDSNNIKLKSGESLWRAYNKWCMSSVDFNAVQSDMNRFTIFKNNFAVLKATGWSHPELALDVLKCLLPRLQKDRKCGLLQNGMKYVETVTEDAVLSLLQPVKNDKLAQQISDEAVKAQKKVQKAIEKAAMAAAAGGGKRKVASPQQQDIVEIQQGDSMAKAIDVVADQCKVAYRMNTEEADVIKSVCLTSCLAGEATVTVPSKNDEPYDVKICSSWTSLRRTIKKYAASQTTANWEIDDPDLQDSDAEDMVPIEDQVRSVEAWSVAEASQYLASESTVSVLKKAATFFKDNKLDQDVSCHMTAMTAGNSAIVAVMTAVQGMGPESTYVADGAILSIVANEAWSQVVDILPENLADVFDTVYRLNNDAKFMALKNSDLSEYLSLMGANPENRGQVFIKKLMAELLACHQFVLDHPFAEFNVKRSEYALSLEKMSPQDMAREAQRVKVDCPNISVFPSERAAVQAKLLDHFSKGHPNDMEAAELCGLGGASADKVAAALHRRLRAALAPSKQQQSPTRKTRCDGQLDALGGGEEDDDSKVSLSGIFQQAIGDETGDAEENPFEKSLSLCSVGSLMTGGDLSGLDKFKNLASITKKGDFKNCPIVTKLLCARIQSHLLGVAATGGAYVKAHGDAYVSLGTDKAGHAKIDDLFQLTDGPSEFLMWGRVVSRAVAKNINRQNLAHLGCCHGVDLFLDGSGHLEYGHSDTCYAWHIKPFGYTPWTTDITLNGNVCEFVHALPTLVRDGDASATDGPLRRKLSEVDTDADFFAKEGGPSTKKPRVSKAAQFCSR